MFVDNHGVLWQLDVRATCLVSETKVALFKGDVERVDAARVELLVAEGGGGMGEEYHIV